MRPKSSRIESNLHLQQHELPRLEVRCKELSVVVETEFVDKNSSGLPSILNTVKHAFTKLTNSQDFTQRRVLHQVNAVFKPGTLTLVLGQPGSGKSTLLKVLSGQLPTEKNVTVKGEISYNGLSWKEVLPKLPQLAAYVPQNDQHFPSLTVQETLNFAAARCGGELSSREDKEFQQYPDMIINQLGLNVCRNTKIGNTMSRGVSGRERRRVTIGEMEFGAKCATFLDEISTGLDSATTFDIVWRQREIAKKQRKTVVMALLQPAPEVYELFDCILLLNNGEVLYHGPREQVLPHFLNLGLVCPLDVDVGDFLLDIATKHQHQYGVVRTESVISTRYSENGK